MGGDYLEHLATISDSDIDLGRAALVLARLRQPDAVMDRYLNHIKKLATQMTARHDELLGAGADDSAETRLAAIKHVMVDVHDYGGDEERYDDLENSSLMRVIDRGKGMPITLCILVIASSRSMGWAIEGLDVPGHFLCRIEHDGGRVIFDPFHGCQIVGAPELRQIIKRAKGDDAELSSAYYEPASNREILIRLQNNIKYRQIDMEDYKGALETVESMRKVDPEEYRLLLDAGVLYARNDEPFRAISVLEDYIKLAPQDRDCHDAVMLLEQIKDGIAQDT